MIKRKLTNTIFLSLLLLLASIFAFSQEAKPPGDVEVKANENAPARPQLFRQLGLKVEQVREIRRLNIERKPLMDAAQFRLREAVRSLDEAIYADQLDESAIPSRIKEVQLAQAEVQRLKYMNEFAVRKILLPDQLIRFRQLRARFALDRIQTKKNGEMKQSISPSPKPANGVRPFLKPRPGAPPVQKPL